MSDLQRVGPVFGGTGTAPPFTADITGAQRVQDAHGRYFDTASRNQVFFAANQAGQTTTVGLATTYVGCVVSNPVGSSVNLVINKIGWMETVIASAVNGVGIAVGYNATTNVTHTTPLNVNGTRFMGTNNGGVARADSSATLPTAPVYYMFMDDTPTATTNPKGGIVDLEGSLIIPPGGYVCTVTTAASPAAAFWASIQWEELPILT